MAVAGAVAGLAAWLGWRWWKVALGHATLALKLGAAFVPAVAAGAIYWLVKLAFKVPAARDITQLALPLFRQET